MIISGLNCQAARKQTNGHLTTILIKQEHGEEKLDNIKEHLYVTLHCLNVCIFPKMLHMNYIIVTNLCDVGVTVIVIL